MGAWYGLVRRFILEALQSLRSDLERLGSTLLFSTGAECVLLSLLYRCALEFLARPAMMLSAARLAYAYRGFCCCRCGPRWPSGPGLRCHRPALPADAGSARAAAGRRRARGRLTSRHIVRCLHHRRCTAHGDVWPHKCQHCQPRLARCFLCCPGSKLQPRPWWGATLHDPRDVQQWFAKRAATDEQPAWAAPVSDVIRDRTRLTALPAIMTDFRKVGTL